MIAPLDDGGALVDLGDVIPGLDRGVLARVLAAVAHAGGSHEHSGFEFTEDGTPTSIVRLARLYDWPQGTVIRAAALHTGTQSGSTRGKCSMRVGRPD